MIFQGGGNINNEVIFGSDGNGVNNEIIFKDLSNFNVGCLSWGQVGETINYGTNGPDNSISLNSNGDIMARGNGRLKGSVKVFELTGGNWVQKGQEFIGAGQVSYTSSNLGRIVKLNSTGDTLAMLAANSSPVSEIDPTVIDAYIDVYTWNGTTWIQKGSRLTNDNYPVLNSFQINIMDLDGSGDNIVIRQSDGCYIFTFQSGDWVQKGLTIPVTYTAFQDEDVAINSSGNIVAVSRPTANTSKGTQAGAIQVFEWNGSSWVQLGSTIEGGESAYENFELRGINADGTRVIGGAGYNGNFALGYIKVYEYSTGTWNQVGQTIYGNEEYDSIGLYAYMNKTGDIIGYIDVNSTPPEIKVYKESDGEWTRLGCSVQGSLTNTDLQIEYFAFNGNGYILGLIYQPQPPTLPLETSVWSYNHI